MVFCNSIAHCNEILRPCAHNAFRNERLGGVILFYKLLSYFFPSAVLYDSVIWNRPIPKHSNNT